MLRLWREGGFDYDGEFWNVRKPEAPFEFVGVHLRPYQRPHPPIWGGGNASPDAITRSASYGEAMTADPSPILKDVWDERVAAYKAAAEERGKKPFVVLMRDDLDIDARALGTGVATFFAFSALVVVPVGRLAERLGPRRTVRSGLLLATIALVGIAAVASAWWMVLALLALAGVANALTQLGVNLLLTRAVSSGRHGIAFGLKQSAIPLSSLLAGI